MESYMISNSKRAKIDNILNPTVRRISHIFDSVEMLETEETPFKDPYLITLSTESVKTITHPFS